jgi:hypothetical protein
MDNMQKLRIVYVLKKQSDKNIFNGYLKNRIGCIKRMFEFNNRMGKTFEKISKTIN